MKQQKRSNSSLRLLTSCSNTTYSTCVFHQDSICRRMFYCHYLVRDKASHRYSCLIQNSRRKQASPASKVSIYCNIFFFCASGYNPYFAQSNFSSDLDHIIQIQDHQEMMHVKFAVIGAGVVSRHEVSKKTLPVWVTEKISLHLAFD